MIKDLNDRPRHILKLVVDAYVETGEPVGSRAVAEKMGMTLSPATIRSVMHELEERGLLYAPHTSAGRLPTETGLAVFVDGLLELDELTPRERAQIERNIGAARGKPLAGILEDTSMFLSGLASCAGLVFAPKSEDPVRQLEFVLLGPGRVLAVLVTSGGVVENRILDVPREVTAASLMRASNYINARLADKTLTEAAAHIRAALARDRAQLDILTARVVETGLVNLVPDAAGGHLFVRGQARLLEDVTALADLERIRLLFEALEAKEAMLRLLQETTAADGVKIFIGAENKLFNHAGCTLVVSPCKTRDARVVGAIGVIGPTRMNYGRIIPVINYTSEIVGRMVDWS